MTERVNTAEPVLWKTALAIPVAIIVWQVSGSIISLLSAFFNNLFFDYREWFVDFTAQLTGGGIGMVAAKMACDRWLKPYSHHVIFMVVVMVAILFMAGQFYMLHVPFLSERTLVTGAHFAASLFVAYWAFWLNEPIE